MKMMNSWFLVLCLLLSACSSSVVRSPAQEVQTLLEEIMTIKTSGNTEGDEAFRTLAEDEVAKIRRAKVVFVFNSKMPPDQAFRLELDINPDSHEFIHKIHYGPHSFKDKDAIHEMINFSQNLNKYMGVRPQAFHELYYNAKQAYPVALSVLLRLKNKATGNYSGMNDYFRSEQFLERVARSDSLKNKLEADVKKLKAGRKKAGSIRKQLEATLDKLPDEEQLKTLIAKNDRKGAAGLIRQYLPWELMAPFEKKYWETYLDVMENPAPLAERVFIFRGVDDDVIHAGYKNQLALTKTDAMKEEKVFFMSTLLVKNQGSWNRRLRSLETMYEKKFGTISNDEDMAESIRFSHILFNHAGSPQGSPFLSFTPDINVGMQFGSKKISSYLIDPRLLTYNYNGIDEEAEFLLGLTTFPDDMAGYLEYKNGSKYDVNEHFKKSLTKRIEETYGPADAENIIKRIKKNSYDFFLKKYDPQYHDGYFADVKPETANKLFYDNLKNAEVKPLLDPAGNMKCTDILPRFWKH